MFSALLVTLSLLSTPSPSALGGEICGLVEGLPNKADPIRRVKAYKTGFRALERSKGQLKKMSKARRLLEQGSLALLKEARDVFRERNDSFKRPAVRRFLDRHVYNKPPSLVLKDEGFALPAPVSTTLAWLQCREGHWKEAINHARPAHLEPSSLVAFAALMLIDQGRMAEAIELQPAMTEEGFLSPFVKVELSTDKQEKIRYHRMAKLRATNRAQHDAVVAQQRRHPALTGP